MFSTIPRQLPIHSNLKSSSRHAAISRMVGRASCFLSSLDLEWKMTYVGDYRSTEGDQVLDDVLVGPITQGTHKFCFQVGGPASLLFVGKCAQSGDYSGRLPAGRDSDSHHLLLPQSRIHPHWILYFEYVRWKLEGLFSNSTRDPCRQAQSHSHAHLLGVVLYYTLIRSFYQPCFLKQTTQKDIC